MKKLKLYALFPLMLFAGGSAAQTLEESTNGLVPMSPFVQYIGAAVAPGEAGEGQQWDMSGLTSTTSASTEFLEENGSNPDYPGATVQEFWMADLFAFYRQYYSQDADGLYFQGTYGSVVGNIAFDYELLMPFPCSYSDVWTDPISYVDILTGASIDGSVIGQVDGWGTLQMPYGDVEGVLRIKLIEDVVITEENGTTEMTATQYSFHKPGIRGPILTIYEANSLTRPGIDFSAMSKWVGPEIALEASEIASDRIAFDLIPNPAAGRTSVLFGCGRSARLEVIDPLGRTVIHRSVKVNSPSMLREDLDLTGLVAGRYAVRLTTNDSAHATRFLVVE